MVLWTDRTMCEKILVMSLQNNIDIKYIYKTTFFPFISWLLCLYIINNNVTYLVLSYNDKLNFLL